MDPVAVYYNLVAAGLVLSILIFFLVLEPIAAAALTVAISRRHANQPATIWLAYRSIGSQAGRLVLSMVWAFLRLIPVITACVALVGVPLLCYFLVAWFFIVPVVVLENGPGSASKRSRDLVRGSWGRTFELVLTTSLSVGGIPICGAAIITAVLTPIPGFADPQAQANVLVIAAVFIRTLMLPIQVGATTLYFYGLKIQKGDPNIGALPGQPQSQGERT